MLSISAASSSKKKGKIDPFTVMNEIKCSLQELGDYATDKKMYKLEKENKKIKMK
jgi:hypothetical protein